MISMKGIPFSSSSHYCRLDWHNHVHNSMERNSRYSWRKICRSYCTTSKDTISYSTTDFLRSLYIPQKSCLSKAFNSDLTIFKIDYHFA
jgi:hypothetical protein